MSAGSHRGTVRHATRASGSARRTGQDRARAAAPTSGRAGPRPWSTPAFAFTELIASWSASTPGDSFVEVEVRGRNAKGVTSSWDLLGRWAAGDQHVRRTTQSPPVRRPRRRSTSTPGRSAAAAGWPPGSCGVSLLPQGRHPRSDRVDRSARWPAGCHAAHGRGLHAGPRVGIELDVPRTPRWPTRGHYPQWGGGGEAWCSPTSTSMVLAYYDALPKPYALPVRARRPPRPVGRLRRPHDLRRRLRRHRQLAVQHRVRRPARRPGVRHPAAVAARGRAVRRRRHPARRLGLVRPRRAPPARRSRRPTATCW